MQAGNLKNLEALWKVSNPSSGTFEGYLFNIKPSKKYFKSQEFATVTMYFFQDSGEIFQTSIMYEPYFYLEVADVLLEDVYNQLSEQFKSLISSIQIIDKMDLNHPGHQTGELRQFIKLSFRNVKDLVNVREAIKEKNQNYMDLIDDLREYDVLYYIRVMIDQEIRCGLWYQVQIEQNDKAVPDVKIIRLKEKLNDPGLTVLAYDIETTKDPLKFPDVEKDQVMMISYMINGHGYLIINREIVSEDIPNFQYEPRPEFSSFFKVANCRNEMHLLQHFIQHIQLTRPIVYVTFNGDSFDWPFIIKRAQKYGISMQNELGVRNDENQKEVRAEITVHIDCLYWVKRDAFLPAGSHGLKAVTKSKLHYTAVELDPELMVPYAKEKPQQLATYSVSDAVATYYLYMIQIHSFIFALSSIIPMCPDDVLRKGSGTLCEQILMAEAYRKNIIFPNKYIEQVGKIWDNNKVMETETYVGGHVECLQVGIYREDIPTRFNLDISAYRELQADIENVVKFCVYSENKCDSNLQISNMEEVKQKISQQLEQFCASEKLDKKPLIYHVDVGAMYPNIILTNKLQPTAIVSEQICQQCPYYQDQKQHLDNNNQIGQDKKLICQRALKWE